MKQKPTLKKNEKIETFVIKTSRLELERALNNGMVYLSLRKAIQDTLNDH